MPVSLSKSLSHVKLFVTSWTVVHQAPLYKEFSWQEYWSGLPLVSSRYPTNIGIKPISPAFQEDFFFFFKLFTPLLLLPLLLSRFSRV